MKSLHTCLLEVKDHRTAKGIRTPLPAFLEMIVLAEMSGNTAIRAISRFIERNNKYFIERYGLLHGAPGYANLRKVLKNIDKEELSSVLKNWSSQFIKPEDWLALDGKVINSTVTNKNDSGQNYLSMVSMFCSKKGIVLGSKSMVNKKDNEIATAKDLIEMYELKGVTFTMDALHCQKKLSKPSWSQEMTM